MLSCARFFVTPWIVAPQAPLPMGFSRQEYWSGLPLPSLGDLPDPGIKPTFLVSPELAGEFFITSATWEAPGGKESLLYFGCWQPVGKGIHRSKGQFPTPPPTGGQELLQAEGGATCRNSTVSSDSHLEIGQWSDQCHLDCFKYSCFSSRVHLFPFL